MRNRLVRIISGVFIATLMVANAAACGRQGGLSGPPGCGIGSSVAAELKLGARRSPGIKIGYSLSIKIGYSYAPIAMSAQTASAMENAARLAVDEYNATHTDCPVTAVSFDSGGEPGKAHALAQEAVRDQDIVAMIGPVYSGESEAVNPIFDAGGLPAITPSATLPSLSKHGWKIFHRGVGDDVSQGAAAGRYIRDVLKAQRVYVIDDGAAYGKGLADETNKVLGSLQVGEGKVKTGDTQFQTLVADVVTSGATVVFYGGGTAEASQLLRQLHAGGWTGTFVGGDAINNANMIAATGTADAEGAIALCPCPPATGAFAAKYKQRFSADPDAYANVAYDLTNVVLEGIAAGKTTRVAMLGWINGYNKQGAATGVTYRWTETGELDPTQVVVYAFKAHDGAWVADQEVPK